MKDFIYEGKVRILYGAGQFEYVVDEIVCLGKKILIVPTASFVKARNLEQLTEKLVSRGATTLVLENVSEPLLSKVEEGISICQREHVEAVIGIGGGVCMDLAKAIAFGACHPETSMEKYLTYEVSTVGLSHLPIVTIPTNPMSGSETNADVQITLDESGMQVGCPVGFATFTWLNPEYVMSLPLSVLIKGQMTVFVQTSCNYLNRYRSILAEHYAEASMQTVLSCLRMVMKESQNVDARGTLMLNSALSLSGIHDLGREIDFVPYPLQSFAQRYLGLSYPEALTGLFPYWLQTIYSASEEKEIFYRYFEKILQVSVEGKGEDEILKEALSALKNLYQEFGIAIAYKELREDPKDRARLEEIIASFGPMQSQFLELTTEKMADIIEAAIVGY